MPHCSPSRSLSKSPAGDLLKDREEEQYDPPGVGQVVERNQYTTNWLARERRRKWARLYAAVLVFLEGHDVGKKIRADDVRTLCGADVQRVERFEVVGSVCPSGSLDVPEALAANGLTFEFVVLLHKVLRLAERRRETGRAVAAVAVELAQGGGARTGNSNTSNFSNYHGPQTGGGRFEENYDDDLNIFPVDDVGPVDDLNIFSAGNVIKKILEMGK